MSTQGFLAFVAAGEEKTTYNKNSSQPCYLGVRVLAWLRDAMLLPASLRAKILELRVVDPDLDDPPTNDDLLVLGLYLDAASIDGGRAGDWYRLLRDLQGDPAAILQAGRAVEAAEFPFDSLYATWGYVIDVDAGTFEVYRGSQRRPHRLGRFAGRGTALHPGYGRFHPVALQASWPLDDLPSDEQFLQALNATEGHRPS